MNEKASNRDEENIEKEGTREIKGKDGNEEKKKEIETLILSLKKS